jgi:gliding motility-associated-like protein
VSVQTLNNQFGCDSVVVTTTSFDPINCSQLTTVVPENPGCSDASDGFLLVEALAGLPPFEYQWTNNLGNSGTGVIGNLNTPVMIDSLPAGNYSITITSQTNGLSEILNATLTAPPPLFLQVYTVSTSCSAGPVNVHWVGGGGTAPYLVRIDGQVVSGAMAQLPDGYHLISLQDAEGCSTDTLLLVEGALLPVITLPSDTSIVLGTVLRIEAFTNLTVWSDISWQPLSDSTCSTCLLQEWTPLQSGQVSVTIWDTAGCPASSSMRIYVTRNPELYIPNVFSPNNDGINDIWKVYAGKGIAFLREFAIYDRWGGLLYRWEGAVEPDAWPGWGGGTADGQLAGAGVYVYLLQVEWVDGTKEVVSGDVTILK